MSQIKIIFNGVNYFLIEYLIKMLSFDWNFISMPTPTVLGGSAFIWYRWCSVILLRYPWMRRIITFHFEMSISNLTSLDLVLIQLIIRSIRCFSMCAD